MLNHKTNKVRACSEIENVIFLFYILFLFVCLFAFVNGTISAKAHNLGNFANWGICKEPLAVT